MEIKLGKKMEIETKIDNINVDEVIKALKKNKAKFLGKFFFRRYWYQRKRAWKHWMGKTLFYVWYGFV